MPQPRGQWGAGEIRCASRFSIIIDAPRPGVKSPAVAKRPNFLRNLKLKREDISPRPGDGCDHSGSGGRRSFGIHLMIRRPLVGKTRGIVARSWPTIGGKTARPSLQ